VPGGGGPASGRDASPTGRRKSTKPLIEIARAETKAEAMAGLERWKERHPDVWPLLEPADVLVDSMRGRQLDLDQDPAEPGARARRAAPAQEPLEVDYDPWAASSPPGRTGRDNSSCCCNIRRDGRGYRAGMLISPHEQERLLIHVAAASPGSARAAGCG
jgi:hypothetical protein